MCGLFGWLGDADATPASAMAARLRHRGPDGARFEQWGATLLGHTRLRILDLSERGDQPISGAGRAWAVFNGEVYNHRELRAWLEGRGRSFRGTSDAEVIPHLFEELGPLFVGRLRGMFAIAIWDAVAHELHLYRDRFGIKPLFYAASPTRFAFASEIGALRELSWIDFGVDAQSLFDFVGLRYVPAPATFYRGVRAVEPGQMITISANGSTLEITRRDHHRWVQQQDNTLTRRRADVETEARLEDAVRSQLESDVPLGAFLSGGIDSSLVCAHAQAAHSSCLQTFNVRFPDPIYDESAAAQRVAAHIGSEHATLDMAEGSRTWDDVRALFLSVGQPFADTSLLAANAVCRRARDRVTVALSGDGGDEGFAGYDAYRSLARIGTLQRLPPGLWGRSAATASALAEIWQVPSSFRRRLAVLSGYDEVALVQREFSALSETEARALCSFTPNAPLRRHFEPAWEREAGRNRSRRRVLLDLAAEVNIRLTLPNDFLVKVDAASMRESLEVRVPMLDERLVGFALAIPWRHKIGWRAGKLPLRRLARGLLPPQIAQRRKHGFGVPLHLWFDAATRRDVASELLNRQSPLRDVFAARVFEPWLHAFARGDQVPDMPRGGLHVRVAVLLATHLFLGLGGRAE